MNDLQNVGFADRLKTSALARQALLTKLRPRPTVVDPGASDRSERRAAELEQVRAKRTADRAAKRSATAAAAAEILRVQAEAETAALDARRGERKQRKALSAADAKAKRDAKYAARKARR